MTYKPRILIPSTEQEFETLCTHVYAEIFNCKTPAMYGRRGQKQYGLDILIYENNSNTLINRIGIQCKHVQKLSFDDKSGDSIVKEVDKADTGTQVLAKLIIVTSLPSNQQLLDKVNTLSDDRIKKDKFPVEIQFWNDIENVIYRTDSLREYYYKNVNSLLIIQIALDLYSKERYIEAIEKLESTFSLSRNPVEIFEICSLLAQCYYKTEQPDNFFKYFNIIKEYAWNNEKYNLLKIKHALLHEDKIEAKNLISSYIDTNPENIAYKILKCELDINNSNAQDFEYLPNEFKNSYNIKLSYLNKYYLNFDFNNYDVVENTIDALDMDRPSFLSISLAMSLMRYQSNKSKYHIIESKLNTLLNELNINKISIPSLKSATFHFSITASYLLNRCEKAKELYDLSKTSSTSLYPETITNLILMTVNGSDNNFFDILYKNDFNKITEEYFLNGLYHFNRIEQLREIIRKSNTLRSEVIQEVKSFIAVSQPEDINFLSLVNKDNLYENNTIEGIVFLSYKLFQINHEDFDLLNSRLLSYETDNLNFKRILANYYFDTNQFRQTVSLTDDLMENENEEIFIINYIQSLIQSTQYAKAKLIIEKYSETIQEYLGLFANQVNNLVYITQDLSIIEPLVPRLERYNNTSWYWRLKIQVSLIKENYGQLKKDFREMPIELDNDAKNITWIVYQEILHSNSQKVLSRIISLWRSNPSDTTILISIQNLFAATLTLDKLKAINPFFDNAPTEVIDGCFVEFEVDNCVDQVFIDSLAYNQNSNIVAHPNDSIGKAFMSKKVGDTVEINVRFGGKSSIIIRDILSISQGIFRNNLKNANGIQNPFNMISLEVDIDSEDSMENFLEQLEQITSSKQNLEEKLELYQKNPMTVSTLANYIGKDVSEIAYNWLNDFRFPLRTMDNNYTNDISLHELSVLLEGNPSVVVDLFTLIELQRTENLDFICNNISIIIPQTVLSILKDLRSSLDNSIQGIDITLSIDNDSIDNNRSNTDLLNNRKDDTQNLIDFIESNFNVVPAYGNDSHSDIVKVINEHYPDSDKSIIRLCQEKSIPLLSLDARLRAIAHQADVSAINFYDYLSEKVSTKNRIENFHVEQFVQNRNSIGFNLENLLNYALKDRHSLNLSINSLLNFMSIHYEFNEAITQLLYLTKGLHFKEIKTTDKFIEDLCNLMLFYLNKSNKLDFHNHKKIINSWFNYHFQLTPIKSSSFQTATTINTNKFYIRNDDSVTSIYSED